MANMNIGRHDTGIFDLADKIQSGAKIGTSLNAAEAKKLAQDHDGAELLVQTSGKHETAQYDVYELTVGDGKSLTSTDLFEHVDFEKDLPQKMGGKSVSIAAESEADGHTYIGHIQSEGKYNGIMHMNERIDHDMSYDD